MSGALDGLRVVELVGLGPAPFAAMMLADHGAEILRVHPPARRAGVASMNSTADVLARGRASVALDLKSEDGRATLLDLLAEADGLIEGFRPGVMERLGLGPGPCLARNPRLVYGRMTGWGQEGPLAARAGHDLNYISITGVLDAIGPAERPVVPLNLIGDFGGGGMLLAFGMLAGLISAARTGRGQVVDAAMSDGVALLSAMIHGFRAAGAWAGGRETNMLDGGAFYYGIYPCADGAFVAVGAIEPQFLAALLAGLGLEPTDFQPQDDRARWPEWRARIAARFRAHPREHWLRIFDGTDACVTPVLDWDAALAHPHNAARGTFIEIDGVAQPAPAPRFSETPAGRPTAPDLGNQNPQAILARWRSVRP